MYVCMWTLIVPHFEVPHNRPVSANLTRSVVLTAQLTGGGTTDEIPKTLRAQMTDIHPELIVDTVLGVDRPRSLKKKSNDR